MGLINKISHRLLGKDKHKRADEAIKNATLRRCRFEVMEERKVLSADPVIAGVNYLENDAGQDTTPDHFEVTFQGGAATTQLTQFVINGDQDSSGDLSDGDMFFDVNDGPPGTGGHHNFTFDAANSVGISESDIRGVTVSEDRLSITVDVDNFEAGDIFAFEIDVDEVERFRTDKIASGVEFEGSFFNATFVDQNFTFENLTVTASEELENGVFQPQEEGIFYDEYDTILAEGETLTGQLIELDRDNVNGQADRTAGAIDAYQLIEKPISISGTVYHDEDLDCEHGADEDGIAGVAIDLQRLNEATGVYETVASAVTDANGNYEFGTELGLKPGTFQLVQTQPDGYLDVGASAGSAGGDVLDDGSSSDNIIGNIEIPLGNTAATDYDFKEVRPASIAGNVWHDENNDGVFDPNEQGIANVLIQVTRVGAKDGVTKDPFAGSEPLFVRTDAQGHYSVDALPPGIYEVVEVNNYPTGNDPLAQFADGKDSIGNVRSITNGQTSNDRFSEVVLCAGDDGVEYNFGEVMHASIKGTVYHDRNDDGVQDVGEEGIAGVVIELFDVDGNVVQTTTTDADGNYCFEDLLAGEYKIRQQQPSDFVDGKDSLGTVDGQTNGEHGDDEFCVVTLVGGDEGVNYNFGELKLAEISGFVHVDNDGDCVFGTSPSDRPIEGTILELLNANGDAIATTTTDANGAYSFGGLVPGSYSVRQLQPADYFTGGERAGDGGGDTFTNLIANIEVSSGQKVTQYNFCETEAAEIHGRVWEDGPAFETADGTLPTDYRNQRDGIYQEGTDTPIAGVRMQLYYFVDPTAGAEGEIAPRPVTISEVMHEYYDHIDVSNPDAPVWVETMADGEYWFQGLQPGSYVVLQVQPEGFTDANDIPGTTTGFTFNAETETETAIAPLTSVFSDVELMDSVVGISVNAGGVSQQNNFTEVSVSILPPVEPPTQEPPFINPPTPQTPRPPGNPVTPNPGITGHGGLGGSEPSAFTQFVGTSRGASFQTQAAVAPDAYTWHLSVVNGGLPRASGGDGNDDSIWQQAGFIGSDEWNRFDMTEAVWTYTSMDEEGEIETKAETSTFGMLGGTPLAGDFDGDGTDEIAIFNSGYWLIDINHNGRWDEQDLFAKLGDAEDRPVVGDWDGDGKDDIGIFGPIWEKDREAIEREPGLANPENAQLTRPKNVPPTDADATNGARVMKLTSYGQQRADVVDHVFGTEDGRVTPVTGDWNGNGIRSIGKFLDGHWDVDVNGDGRFDGSDQSFTFGRAGDVPLVGDFNGDGIEEIAVYRSGKWLIDTNGNRELDATDKTFEMGGASDKPVMGDFNGDGIDEPALYSPKVVENIQL